MNRVLLFFIFGGVVLARDTDALGRSTTHPDLRVKLHIGRAELNFYERLEITIEERVDSAVWTAKRAKGNATFLIDIRDSNGSAYRARQDFAPNTRSKPGSLPTEGRQRVLVLPGVYELTVQLYFSATEEQAEARTDFRIRDPERDFLRYAWSGLPAIEYLDDEQPPDSWYQPQVRGEVEWARGVEQHAKLTVLMNVAASVSTLGSAMVTQAGLPVLTAMAKVLGTMTGSRIEENFALLDMGRHRVLFEQQQVRALNWEQMRGACDGLNTMLIDVHALAGRNQDAQYFVSQIARNLREQAPRVVVILTMPLRFEPGMDLTPIDRRGLGDPDVFYLRYRADAAEAAGHAVGDGRQPRRVHVVIDELEATLKPLHPTVKDIASPIDELKALEEIRKRLTEAL